MKIAMYTNYYCSNNNNLIIWVFRLIIIINLNNVVQLKSVALNESHNAVNENGTTNITNFNNKPTENAASSMDRNSLLIPDKPELIHTHLDYLKQDLVHLNDKKKLHEHLRAWTNYHVPLRQTAKKNNSHQHFYTHFNELGVDNSTLSIYLSFSIDRLNRQHENHYYQFRHYFHNWIRQEPQTFIKSSEIVHCRHADKGTYLCPLNTRPLCTVNGTIYCIATLNNTQTCRKMDPQQKFGRYPLHNDLKCLESMVPCIISNRHVNADGVLSNKIAVKCQADKDMWMERIIMPCLTNVIIEDEFETKGPFGHRMTLVQISGTYALVAAVPKLDRTFCAPIIVDFVPYRV